MRKFKNANEEAEHILHILGEEPPEVDETIRLNINHYLFYNKRHNIGQCSFCGEYSTLKSIWTMKKEAFINNYNIEPPEEIKKGTGAFICPKCGAHLQAYPAGYGRGNLSYGLRAAYWAKTKKGKTLYYIVKLVDIDFKAGKARFRKTPREIYIYGIDGPRKLHHSWNNWEERKTVNYSWEGGYMRRTRYWFNLTCNSANHLLPGSYLKYAYDPDGICLDIKHEYYDEYIDIIDVGPEWAECEYLKEFMLHPGIEVLTKTGFFYLIEQRIRDKLGLTPNYDRCNLSTLNWNAVKLQKIFRGLNMNEIREIRDNYYDLHIIREYQKAKKKGLNVSVIAVSNAVNNYRIQTIEDFEHRTGEKNLQKTLRYLQEQGISSIDYGDYLRQCDKLQLDLEDKKIRYPEDFVLAHNVASEAIDELNRKERLEKQRTIKKRFKEKIDEFFPEGYIWSCDGLLIRPALSPAELTKEGNAMHHCVGGYSDHVAEGRSYIIFIREEDSPDKSFVTMECTQSFDRMIQIRAKANRSPEDAVKKTAEKWLQECRAEYIKIEKEKIEETA